MFSFFLGVCLRVELLGHMVTRTGFPSGSVVMNPPAIAGDVGSVPVLEGSPREGNVVDPKSRRVTVYDFEHDELPASYTFNDIVPLMISNGEFSVDFVKICRVLERYAE